jgi:hypothetical protein
VAIGVTREGYREILGIMEGPKEDKSGWSAFLRHLMDRGLSGVQLIVSDACRGLVESVTEYLPDARWQRCVVHFYRNDFSLVPSDKVRDVSKMLKAIHAQEGRKAAAEKMGAITSELRRQRLAMVVIQIAHTDIKRFDSPEHEPYDRYVIKLQTRASALLQEHSDVVLFANYQISVAKSDVGFNKKVTRALGSGARVMHTEERPAFLAKNRYGLPDILPLSWSEFLAAMPQPE